MTNRPLLQVKNLNTSFFTDDGELPAVEGISFELYPGEIVGIVGESGSGKSVTSLSIMRLLPSPPGKITAGEVYLNGENILQYNEKQMRHVRGNEMAMIFQEPMTSLNPLFTIGNQLMEAVLIHHKWSKKKAFERAVEMLRLVGLPRQEELMNAYPHELSGGMRQRVMIAMALICDPKVLIADEPTTALDVTIQAQILQLIKEINEKLKTAVLLITHDLGVVAEGCERVIVMYAGKIVEEGDVHTIFQNPQHPYTKGLLQSIPDIRKKEERLFSIPGTVPKPGSVKQGCRFYSRCNVRESRCLYEHPPYFTTEENHNVRCWLAEKEGEQRERTTFTTSQ
ncbi:ABC transporter ATP-binding protein [Fervidibacillus albus]|uniref:ABC transporter ATP-binding protein n=1 Tax=Fervidibacillus albus TaxID=2980026 RepID=A0A9E8LUW6_9BACI|nr:ABC transporter ATP-binding protein [Fervidibacillus albus]WAA09596.1 ABC transporter ATP-binding protein [Fervidibacillus albus]